MSQVSAWGRLGEAAKHEVATEHDFWDEQGEG
jgi:hypothetical protein